MLNIQFLNECFVANFVEGTLHWKMTRPQHHFTTKRGWINWHNKNPGKPCGHIDANGYPSLKLTIDGKELNIKQHHIIYAMYHEDSNKVMIDHVDGDRSNNSISNIRPTTRILNPKNRKLSIKNKSGISGICHVKGRPNLMKASIIVDGKTLTKTSADFFELCCFRKSWELKLGIVIRSN